MVMALFVLLCLPIASWVGPDGWFSILAASAICLVSGLAALYMSFYFNRIGQGLTGMLFAMACRLVPPLFVCVWLAFNQEPAEYSSFVGFLIVSYLVSLAAETFLSVRMLTSSVCAAPSVANSPNR